MNIFDWLFITAGTMKISRLTISSDYLIPFLLLLCLLSVSFLLPFNGLYGQDAHEYLRLTRALHAYFDHGAPVAHSYFPISYSLMAWLFSKAIGSDIIALQLVSMIALVAAFIYLKQLISLLFREGAKSNVYLLTFFFLSPYALRFGLLGMSDMLCLFFVIAAVYHCLRYVRLLSPIDAGLFSLFAGFALSTRYAVMILLLFPAIVIISAILRGRDYLAAIFLLLLFCCALLPDWIIRGRILFLQRENGHFFIDYASNAYAWSANNFFRSAFQNADGSQHYSTWNIVAATFNIIHPAFLFAGMAGLLFLKREDFAPAAIRMLSIMVLAYGLFIAGLQYQNNRYLLQSFPMVLLIFYPAFMRMETKFLTAIRIRWLIVSMIAVIQLALFFFSFQKIYSINCTEREIAASLQEYAGQTVYTCDIVGALSSYQVKNLVIDLYFNRVAEALPNSLLLFNYDYFSQHFQNKNPMLNWDFFRDHFRLRVLRSYPDGWVLYSIEPGR